MRIVFSRKGFDGGSGGAPSPIVGGVPVSLPIPYDRGTPDTYGSLGMGEAVARASRGRLGPGDRCHYDPQFAGGRWAFGQTAAAQTHLANRGVREGDVFLFFGLFATDGRDPHHRIFGHMTIESIVRPGASPGGTTIAGFARHPHVFGEWDANNTVYLGPGAIARHASPALRLSRPGRPASEWQVPPWLRETGLTYHGDPARWLGNDGLRTVGRGQEFVTDIGERADALAWLAEIRAAFDA